ncbi:MAG: excinuclease ABC subunit UvrC [Clostridia bacterium]|nr:excinuclease ABC subunit UvrC [Clostridia bacterium]
MTQTVADKLALLPDSPGCYLMQEKGEILYVGKAVNLKSRVRSYFHGRDHAAKVTAMVQRVDDFDTILCDTELEALVLECNLIKRHKPYYNILLRDDKHYPYIRLDEREAFPRVELVRRIEKDGARYFGPYYSAVAVHEVLDVLRHTFPLRTCKAAPDSNKPRRPCVHHEIGECLAPCAGLATREQYRKTVREVVQFLQGKPAPVVGRMRAEMNEAARLLSFERAAGLRDKLQNVERLLENQKAISTGGGERDVVAIAQDGLDAMAQVLHVRGGRMIGGNSFALERAGDEPVSLVIVSFLMQYYEDGPMLPGEILVESLPDEGNQLITDALSERRGGKVRLIAPVRGEKRSLILLAKKNAADALLKRNATKRKTFERTGGAVRALADAIGLPAAPARIEGFDISNTQGAQSVASMVVFIDGAPAYKEYRHYRIKTVEGPNDFASMEEVVGRRFRRGLAEKRKRDAGGLSNSAGGFADFPDLVLIDGGPQQLDFARRAMLEAGANVPMFGLAERLEEIWLPGAETPIVLDRHSQALHLIQRVRDEAHRFAISHHRALRAKQTVRSRLEEIPGIGPKRRSALFKRFRSLEAIREATVEELMNTPGMSKAAADAVIAWFQRVKGED